MLNERTGQIEPEPEMYDIITLRRTIKELIDLIGEQETRDNIEAEL